MVHSKRFRAEAVGKGAQTAAWDRGNATCLAGFNPVNAFQSGRLGVPMGEIEFVDELPKTPSGKIQRFILRNRAKEEVEA